MKALAVIPARGGSKRIPRKNIRNFHGKPIIAWSIEATRASGCFDDIIVSTDDAEIAEVARAHGASTPFLRPAELADDFADTRSVIRHAQRWYLDQDINVDAVCCIYATAPFVQADDLRAAHDVLVNERCAYVLPITEYGFPIQRAVRLRDGNRLQMLYPDQFGTRSQDLEKTFHDAGQFYWGFPESWASDTPIFGADSVGLPIPSWRVQDIDTVDDWRRAELAFALLQAGADNND